MSSKFSDFFASLRICKAIADTQALQRNLEACEGIWSSGWLAIGIHFFPSIMKPIETCWNILKHAKNILKHLVEQKCVAIHLCKGIYEWYLMPKCQPTFLAKPILAQACLNPLGSSAKCNARRQGRSGLHRTRRKWRSPSSCTAAKPCRTPPAGSDMSSKIWLYWSAKPQWHLARSRI